MGSHALASFGPIVEKMFIKRICQVDSFVLWKHRLLRPFPSSPGPLYQNEVKCSVFDMEMILHSYADETHFNKKGCSLGLI